MGVEHTIRPLTGLTIDLIELIDYRGKISNFAEEYSKVTNEETKMQLTITLVEVKHKIRPLIGKLMVLIELIC